MIDMKRMENKMIIVVVMTLARKFHSNTNKALKVIHRTRSNPIQKVNKILNNKK